MIKYLTKHGNSLALVIEKGILDILGITRQTPLKISTDGSRLIITPLHDPERRKKFKAAVKDVTDRHAKTFQKLAE